MPDFDWNIPLPLHFGQAETPQMSLARALPDDPQRPVFEAFIQQRFRKAHGADIRHFMPELFGMNNASGALCAVAGVRLASSGPLFLERYLDEPIEPLISAAADRPVDRAGIVEVGNLAASDTGSARMSIIAITYLLAMGGLEWVAFTGNIGLVNSFHRLGLKPVTPVRRRSRAAGRRPPQLGQLLREQALGARRQHPRRLHPFAQHRDVQSPGIADRPSRSPAMSPEMEHFKQTLRSHAERKTNAIAVVGRSAESGLRHAVRRSGVSPAAFAR